jgi:hypothetical protein
MKYLKLFESFDDDIKSICDELNITNWTVNSDGTVDVDGDVNIAGRRLKTLPLKFGKVTGHFACFNNELTSLEGAPREVGGHFMCDVNKLVSLKGAPKEVGGSFHCMRNKLTTLEGGPREVSYFDCHNNPIWNVYELFPNHKAFMESLDYDYLRGINIDRKRFEEALDEIGIELPESIRGYKYI